MLNQHDNHHITFKSDAEIIAEAETLLLDDHLDYARLRPSFDILLTHYKKLHHQLSRLNRINDRNQLIMRQQQDKLIDDQRLVEAILTKMNSTHAVDDECINHFVIPVDKTAGDFVFAQRRPDGILHLLVGDITGHGLPAAIIGPEVSSIFYTMTRKGFSAGVILAEINQRLNQRLPISIYMAATMLEIDIGNRIMMAWNGGLPNGIIFRAGAVVAEIPSTGFPLGIVNNNFQDWHRTAIQLETNDRIFLYSDGITESRNPSGEQFGISSLIAALSNKLHHHLELSYIVEQVRNHVDHSGKFEDDLTLVEVQI